MSKPDLKTRTRLAMSELLDRVLSSAAPRHPATPSRALDLSELEERVLLSASPMLAAAEMVQVAPADAIAESSTLMNDGTVPNPESENSASGSSDSVLSSSPSQNASREVVFLDTSVEDYQQLLDDLWVNDDPRREIEVVLLSNSRDGIDQISEALAGRSKIDSVHLVTHGTDRAVKLGSTWLTNESLAGYAGEIARWGNSLSAGADVLFYGCHLAGSESGLALLESVQLLTGADIAASTDDTGAAVLGGDWDLEYTLGAVETQIAFSESVQDEWGGLLNTFVVTTTADGGAGSLRQAIIDANALSGSDTITIAAGTYALTVDGDNEEAASAGDLDITDDVIIQGVDAESTILDAAGLERFFDVRAGSVTLSGVTIQNGDVTTGSEDGGAIRVLSGAALTVDDAVFQNNDAGRGGAILSTGTLVVSNTTFDSNMSTGSGGAAGISGSGNGTFTNVTFSNNVATVDAGALGNDGTSSLLLTNVTISGNTAGNGAGGLGVIANATLQNVTIVNNTATVGGGGLYVYSGTTTARNVLIANNNGGSGGHDVFGTVSSLGNNLISDSAGSSGFGGTDLVNVTPDLGLLSNYGGTTKTHALLTGSRGIDEGSATGAPSTDQRSLNRDTTPDIGAFEYFSSTTLSLQEGVDGYSGTQDTQLDAVNHNVVFGAETTLNVDQDTSASAGDQPAQALIRFDNLFGTAAGQIPLGSIITSATLTLETTGTSTGDFQLHRMLTSWDESTATWDSFIDGLDSGSEYAASSDSTLSSPSTTGPHDFTGLVDTLQLWSDGSTNNGWAILADSGDGFDFASSENATSSFRPQLSVEFVAAPVVTLPGATVSYTENDPATIIDGSATVSDVDSADFNTGTLTVDFQTNGTANDRLAILNEGTDSGQIGVSGSNVTYEGTTIGTFTGGTGGSDPLVITLNANATPTAV